MNAAPSTEPADGGRASSLSLRSRLTLWVIAIFSAIQLATTGVYGLYQSASADRKLDVILADRARRLVDAAHARLPRDGGSLRRPAAPQAFQDARLAGSLAGVFALDGSSALEGSTLPSLPRSLDWERALGADEIDIQRLDPGATPTPDTASRSVRAVTRRFPVEGGDDRVLVLIAGDGPAAAEKASVWRGLLMAAAIGPVAAGIAGWFIAGIAVAPFAHLREAARHLRPESLGDEISVAHSGAEIEGLTRELENSRRQMEAAFARQERFLSNVSHEIKTPIAVLLVEAQTLDRKGLPAPALAFIRSAEQEMLRLGRMVESFLTLTRVHDGKGSARDLVCPANDVVMESIESCRLLAAQHGARLRPLLLEEHARADTCVRGDPDLLRTMLDNLIWNAIRFTPNAQPVDVRMALEGDRLVIDVADRGPGMPPEQIVTCFDRFVQAPEEQRRGRGHGLGLAIAQGIAELHGGLIRVANRPDGGCVFTISLPALESRPPALAADHGATALAAAPGAE